MRRGNKPEESDRPDPDALGMKAANAMFEFYFLRQQYRHKGGGRAMKNMREASEKTTVALRATKDAEGLYTPKELGRA
jgi:hypothetical protein